MTYKKTPQQRWEYYHRNINRCRAYHRRWREKGDNKEKRAEYNREWNERLKRGEIELPPLDWAICERGGSPAQARAHYRRKEKPCENCRRAAYRDAQDRKALREQARIAA
jgi:hypothetical protein